MASDAPVQADAILNFWFQECRPIQWFQADPGMDSVIRSRFGTAVQQAIEEIDGRADVAGPTRLIRIEEEL